MLAAFEVPENPNVTKEDRTVPGPDGDPDIAVRIYRPLSAPARSRASTSSTAAAWSSGTVAGEDPVATMLCDALARSSSPSSTASPPSTRTRRRSRTATPGCSGLAKNAAELGIDPERIALYGGSAGGGLVLGTALLARDRSGPPLRFLMPIYPMIDDTNTTASSHEITDIGIWDRAGNIEAWNWYLGGRAPTSTPPRPAPSTSRAAARPTSTSAPSTCSATRTSPSPSA